MNSIQIWICRESFEEYIRSEDEPPLREDEPPLWEEEEEKKYQVEGL